MSSIFQLALIIIFTTKVEAATVSKTFATNIRILTLVTISETQTLRFPPLARGQTADIVVDPTSSNAASFNLTGHPNKNFTRTVVANINMTTGNGAGTTKKIPVDSFTFSGPTAFDGIGNANGVKIGATAHVLPEDILGAYTGVATLRIIY